MGSSASWMSWGTTRPSCRPPASATARERRKSPTTATLIRYLMRHRHTTPFEMAEIKFLVRVPMDCWRQWIRHRTANVNEYSTRYSVAIDSAQTTPPEAWRTQADQNRQGSGDPLPAELGRQLTEDEQQLHRQARQVLRGAAASRRGPRTGPQGFAAVDVHRSLLEDRPAQPAALSGAADGRPRPAGNPRCTPTAIGEEIVQPLFPDRLGSVRRLPHGRHVPQPAGSGRDAAADGAARPQRRAAAIRSRTFWPPRTKRGKTSPAAASGTNAAKSWRGSDCCNRRENRTGAKAVVSECQGIRVPE